MMDVASGTDARCDKDSSAGEGDVGVSRPTTTVRTTLFLPCSLCSFLLAFGSGGTGWTSLPETDVASTTVLSICCLIMSF